MANKPSNINWKSAFTKKHIREARVVGLELIGPGKNKDYRTYRFIKCHHKKEFQPVHIRRRKEIYLCDQCPVDIIFSARHYDFINASKLKYGNQFTYEKTIYINRKTKLTITCKDHGDLDDINPEVHLREKTIYGCKFCKSEVEFKETLDQRISKFKKDLKNKSNDNVSLYEETYTTMHDENTKFHCKKHGDFTRKPVEVLTKFHPCIDCSNELRGVNLDHEDIKNKVKQLQGKFIIKEINGIANDLIVSMKCMLDKKHKDFEIKTFGRLNRKVKNGKFACPRCAYLTSMNLRTEGIRAHNLKRRKAYQEKWIKDCNEFHNYKYDYSLVEYITQRISVNIICPYHGSCPQKPDAHKTKGCRLCANEDLKGLYSSKYFDYHPEEKGKPAILYYVKIKYKKFIFFKIGMTIQNVNLRHSGVKKFGFKVTPLYELNTSLHEAFELEQMVIDEHGKKYPVKNVIDKKLLRKSRIGLTEIFTKPISKKMLKRVFCDNKIEL